MTTSIYVVEKQNKHSEYRKLVGVYDSKELADEAGANKFEFDDPDNWQVLITILPLNDEMS